MAHCKNVSGPTAGSGGTPAGDGGDDRTHCLTPVEKGKGKKVATKKKASDRDAEIAEAVATAAEAADRGGLSGALRIRSDLTIAQRRALLEVEQRHGSPPGTIMLGGQRVRINVTEPGQEELETEAKAQVEGLAEVQQEEQSLRRSTCAHTQAASKTGTHGQSTLSARSTLARGTPAPRPAPARIHKDYTLAPTREIQELRFAPFLT